MSSVTPGFFSSNASSARFGSGSRAQALLHPGAGEQPVLQGVVGHLARQPPA
jgi:hypothetical protein